jgi:hypothetical protein
MADCPLQYRRDRMRMNILVVSHSDEVLIPVLTAVCEKLGANVSDWFINNASKNPAIQPHLAFPGVTVHVPDLSSRGLFSSNEANLAAESQVIDQPLLNRMAAHENIFMRMLDIFDPTGSSFSGRERREAYYHMLRFGLAIFEARKPQLMITGTIPHSLQDYILYAFCKEYSVPVLSYIPTNIPGYLIAQESMAVPSLRLRRHFRQALESFAGGEVKLPDPVERHLEQSRQSYAIAEPWYVKLRDHAFLRERSLRDWIPNPLDRHNYFRRWMSRVKWSLKFASEFALGPRQTRDAYFRKPLDDYFKMPGVPLSESVNTRYSNWRVIQNGMRSKNALYRQYRSLQISPDLSAPFIYVPLHYQPEASTYPLGQGFIDQNLMIKMLSRHLPSGWRIYVKEHRTTFDPQLRGHFARDLTYYPQIAGIANAYLVPMTFSSFDLMDKCKAVAAVTGTAAWEAVVRGVPSIVFGAPWFKDCEGVFDGSEQEKCASALLKISQGFKPDYQRVRLFARSLAQIGVYADRDQEYVLTDLSAAQSIAALIEHLLREYAALGEEAGLPRG